jgi:DNA primase
LRFDDQFIQKVIEANNITEIIGQYTDLKGRGDQHMGLCPFPDHNEKSPSFSVSESKQLYHCFGCKKGGNILTFLKDYSGLSFVEAVEYLANRASLELPKPTDQPNAKPRVSQDVKKQMQRANRFAAVFYHQKLKSLPKNHKLRAYLQKRKLTPEIIEEFRLGYAPEAWDELTQYLLGRQVPSRVVERLGLIRANKKGGHYDLFRDRLMFPIFAIDSEVIGFGGRIIDQGQPKYINSTDSEVFKKGKHFYGLDKAAKHIRAENQVFVVEGYMDLLALYSRGVRNVVATLGTALTEDHAKRLKRWTGNVILLFDGDQAGQTAAERSLPQFFKQNLVPQVFPLPDGMDPDDFISQKGVEAFRQQAAQSTDLFLHLMGDWFCDFRGTPKEKIHIVDKAGGHLKLLGDQRLVQIYVEELARRLSEEPRKVYHWLFGGEKPKVPVPHRQPQAEPPSQEDKVSLRGVAEDELVLLSLSLKSLKYMNFFIKHEGLGAINHQQLKDIFAQVVARYGQEPDSFDKLSHLVVSRVENPKKIVNLINISPDESGADQGENLMKECLIRVKDRHLERQAQVIVTQMKNSPSDADLERFVNIQNERKALKEIKKSPLGE